MMKHNAPTLGGSSCPIKSHKSLVEPRGWIPRVGRRVSLSPPEGLALTSTHTSLVAHNIFYHKRKLLLPPPPLADVDTLGYPLAAEITIIL